jgi:TonB family protein
MIKAKEVSLKNIVIFLLIASAFSVGYFMARPKVLTKNVPVFVGEEVLVREKARVVTKVRAAKAEKAERTVMAEKLPLSGPKIETPLPLIPPVVTFKILPSYPLTALEKELGGVVVLSVYVGLTGQPEKIETKVSSGIPELDQAAVASISQWRFSPAKQGAVAVASWYEIPVRFEVK